MNNSCRKYKAGIYARISAEQGKKTNSRTNKNESLEVQIEIAKKYVEEFNRKGTGEVIDVVQCYTDLGKTGTNFERKGFQQLLQDIRLGEINCVIVKDLSRFGRNYLEAGNYIEKIFPFLGVRFIAVADGYDSGSAGNENKQMVSEIKNLVNDMYAKDFSQKAKIHLRQRRESGSYVGGPPPYGYTADWVGKRRVLIPDDNTAVIVRFIFEKFVETECYTAVTDELNRRKINPPVVYKKTGNVYYSTITEQADGKTEYKGWNRGAIVRILQSDTYVGMLVQGKTSLTARNEDNRIYKPKEEWVVIKEAHEPLIDMELYLKSVEIRKKMAEKMAAYKHPSKGYPLEEDIFDGVLYCGVCGKKMTRNSTFKQYASGEKARLDGYFCLNSGQKKVETCPDMNRISKTELVDILLPLIRMEFALYLGKGKKYLELGKEQISQAIGEAEAALRKIEVKRKRARDEESRMYMDYRAGQILQKDYVAYKMKKENTLNELKKVEEQQQNRIVALEKLSGRYLLAIRAILKLKSGKELTKEIIEGLISKIYVYPGKRIEVLFAFTADCMEGVK